MIIFRKVICQFKVGNNGGKNPVSTSISTKVFIEVRKKIPNILSNVHFQSILTFVQSELEILLLVIFIGKEMKTFFGSDSSSRNTRLSSIPLIHFSCCPFNLMQILSQLPVPFFTFHCHERILLVYFVTQEEPNILCLVKTDADITYTVQHFQVSSGDESQKLV